MATQKQKHAIKQAQGSLAYAVFSGSFTRRLNDKTLNGVFAGCQHTVTSFAGAIRLLTEALPWVIGCFITDNRQLCRTMRHSMVVLPLTVVA